MLFRKSLILEPFAHSMLLSIDHLRTSIFERVGKAYLFLRRAVSERITTVELMHSVFGYVPTSQRATDATL